jgi:2-dehydropantoate 2-reductase
MRILVVGAGAVGGYFGGRLVKAGRDVTFLVRPSRAKQIETQGLRIVSPGHGDLAVQPKAITSAQIASPYDVILLSVKSYSLAAAMDDFVPAVGPQTVIVPVLNGMRHMDVLTLKFGEKPVLGGVCVVATEVDSQGRIVQLANFQSLSYGELDRKKTPRIEAVHRVFSGAGFETSISEDILRDMWQKWVWLATLGTITCLLRGNVGEIATVPGGAELSLLALRECAGIAGACGYPLSEAFLADKSSQLSASDSTLTSSMYRDLQKQASVEVDTIIGDLIERGRERNISAPIVQAAFVSLSIYERALTVRQLRN